MVGITVYLYPFDKENATDSFKLFEQEYEDSSRMVPEWRGYYKPNKVKILEDALDAGNVTDVYIAIGEIGETCADCHYDTMPPVYNKYYGGDFSNLYMDTPEGSIQWKLAKMKYLLGGFDGIGVFIKQNNSLAANQSFELFEDMFYNMSATCGGDGVESCHLTEPGYYVSDDIQTLITDMGDNITSGNYEDLQHAELIRYEIGDSCHRCHIIHIPAHYAKLDGI